MVLLTTDIGGKNWDAKFVHNHLSSYLRVCISYLKYNICIGKWTFMPLFLKLKILRPGLI